MRILQAAPATLTVTFEVAGQPTNAGAVTVAVTRDNGDPVASGAASAVSQQPGVYTFPLTAVHTADLDRLTAVWTSASLGERRTRHPVAGGFYFPLHRLADKVDLDAATLHNIRERVENRIEKATGVAWVPRYAARTVRAIGVRTLRVDLRPLRDIVSATVDGEDVDLDDVDVWATGRIDRVGGWAGRVRLAAVYGYDEPPYELADAAYRAAADLAAGDRSGRASERSREWIVEGETMNFSALANLARGRPFGMPDIDAIVMSHDQRLPTVG